MSGPVSCRLCASPAAVLVLLFPAAAVAFELPPVGGIDVVGSEEKLLQVEVGVFYGLDTNVARSSDGSEIDDSFRRILGGVAFGTGNDRRRVDFQIQMEADSYSEHGQYDFSELRTRLGLQLDTNSLLPSLRLEYAKLEEPADIELTDLVKRTRFSLYPNVDVRLGEAAEVALGYTLKSSEYDAPLDYLDYDEKALAAELRLGRSGTRQVFVHFDNGDFEYGPGIRDDDDFAFDRLYGGLRAEAPRSAHEFAVGVSNVETASLPSAETFLFYRSTFALNETRALLVGVARGPEASVGAEYKVATRFMVGYRQEVNSRWGWTAGVTQESADLVVADPGFPSELSRFEIKASVAANLGSPDRLRGRGYAGLDLETRSGSASAFDYSRLRFTVGISLAY